MNPDQSRVISLFADALECNSPAELAEYLDRACGGEVSLRARVEALVKAHREAGDFLGSNDSTGTAPTIDQPAQLMGEDIGSAIGPYKLLEQIGEGGMGVVYMADQQSPIQRRIALKIIKPGMDSRQVIARFEAERQALALMDHPNIAKVFDAGTTESGRPYFVMELVRGIPITEYCDQNSLSLSERLELFIHVCHAVQHAHQKGIIHRDLKPSNVLVTLYDSRPVPKVIDFGVAKAINQRLTEKTLFTNFAQMVGTPLYMSPEQAELSGLDVDTRSDIYSLGVLLYELLTSTTPFDRRRMHEAAFDEIRRIIREEEPPRPSTRVSTLGESRTATAAHRKAAPNRLSQLLKGELDWVVMKALEKDRTHRYETANGLARDIQRYLSDQPVEACPPSAAYRFRKFARRNRAALATASLVALVLLLGILGSTWQAVRATRAEGLAEARLITETRARTEADLAREAEAEQRMQAESQRAEADKQRFEAEANLQKAKQAVNNYFTLVSESRLLDVPGLQPLRKEMLDSALEFYKTLSIERIDDPVLLADLATTYMRVAEVNHTVDRNDDAVAAIGQALQVVERLLKEFPQAERAHRQLAGYWKGFRRSVAGTQMPKNPAAAFRTINQLMQLWETLAARYPDQPAFRSDLGALYERTGDLLASGGQLPQSLVFFEKSRAIRQLLVEQQLAVPEYRADLARTNEQLARCFAMTDRGHEAEAACGRALALREQLVAQWPKSPQYRGDLGVSLMQSSDFVLRQDRHRAVEFSRRALDLFENLAREYPEVDLYRSEINSAKKRLIKAHIAGFGDEPTEIAVQPLDQWIAECPSDQATRQSLASALRVAANDLKNEGSNREASELYQRALDQWVALSDENPQSSWHRKQVGHSHRLLGGAASAIGNYDAARTHFEQAAAVFQGLAADTLPQGDEDYRELLAETILQIAYVWRLEGNKTEATKALRRCLSIREELAKQKPPDWRQLTPLRDLLDQIGDVEKTLEVMGEIARLWPDSEWPRHHYGRALMDIGRFEEAIREFERALEIAADPWTYFHIANIRLRQERLPEALDAARSAIRMRPPEYQFHARLLEVLNKIGDPEKTLNVMQENAQLASNSEPAHHLYALVLKDQGRLVEAVREFDRGLEINPNTPWSHFHIAGIQLRQNKLPEALAAAQSAVRIDPANHEFHSRLLEVLNKMGDTEGVKQGLTQISRLTADFSRNSIALATRMGFVVILSREGRFEEAAKSLEGLDENDSGWGHQRALLYLQTGRIDAYRRLCQSALMHASQTGDAWDAASAGIQCKLAPHAREDCAQALGLLKKAVREHPEDRLFLGVQAHLLHRCGQAELATQQLEDLVSSDDIASIHQPFNKLFLAMAHHELGHDAEAQRYFGEGVKWIDQNGQPELNEGSVVPEPLDWFFRLEMQLLRAEAEKLLKGHAAEASSADNGGS